MRDLGYVRPQIGPNFPEHSNPPRLAPGQWALKYDRCQDCGTRDRPHQGLGFCTACYGPNLAKRDRSRVEPGSSLPRRNPRRKGIHQALADDEIDGAIAMLQAGKTVLDVREKYSVGLAAIRAGLKTRGLTPSQVKLQTPSTARSNKPLIGASCWLTPDEHQRIRDYAVEHRTTMSDVLRMALEAFGILAPS